MFVDQLERQGTHDPAAYLSVSAAIAFQNERGWPSVRKQCHELVRLARHQIADLTGIEPQVADDPQWFAQMAVLPLPPAVDAPALKSRLYDEYRIEIPAMQWGGVPCLRVSVQGYNTHSDIERLVAAVRALLP